MYDMSMRGVAFCDGDIFCHKNLAILSRLAFALCRLHFNAAHYYSSNWYFQCVHRESRSFETMYSTFYFYELQKSALRTVRLYGASGAFHASSSAFSTSRKLHDSSLFPVVTKHFVDVIPKITFLPQTASLCAVNRESRPSRRLYTWTEARVKGMTSGIGNTDTNKFTIMRK